MGMGHKLIKLLTIYVYFIIYMYLSVNTSFRYHCLKISS